MKGKLAVICLLLFILCSISTVCAENANDTQIMQENNALDNLEASEDAILMNSSDDLQNIVNSATEGSTVTLNKNYTLANRISIDKSLIINGAGNTIDCSKASVRSSSGEITLKNLKFANGNADNGGALYITGSARFTIINCTFTNNKVNNFGGAIYNNVVDTLTITNCKFIGNEANSYGGAIYSKGDIVVDKSIFENNFGKNNGGALSCEKSVDVSNSVFTSNKAVDGMIESYGGAIRAKKDLFIDNCTFKENSATYGGAVYSYSDLIIENSQFLKNTAKEGGAVEAGNDNHLYIENTTFKENSAKSNGGGAIYSNKWIHVGNSIFELNTANSKGGAIQTDYIQFSGTNKFTNNSANDHGGAVYADKIGDVNSNLIFNGNHVNSDFGGAIYINKKSGDIKFLSSIFTNNYANAGDGGAVYSDSGSTNLEFYNCTFISNYANGGKERRYGGAVRSCNSIKVDNCTFKDNWAENYGGAIYTNTISEIKNSVFISNQVRNGGNLQGGAIYVNNACTMTITGNYFERNGGGSHGGVLYIDSKDSHLKLTNNAFIDNSAFEQGVSVYNKGYYDDVSNNWWGVNGASIGNQLKEYHTVGSNTDKFDGSPLVVSLASDKNVYSNIKTTIKVSFTGTVPYYVLDTLKYSTNKNGTFLTKKINSNSLELIYVPSEGGIHKINFTINSQKLSCDLNVTYISVYGYDIQKNYGDGQLYSAVFMDKNGKYLPKGTKVTFNVNNTNYASEIVDNYGSAVLNVNLEPGQYTVKAINNVTGQSYTNKITVAKRNIVFDINDPYIIKLNTSANKTVTFKVGSKTFTATTSEGGYAYFILNVTAGNYTVETTYEGKTIKEYITVSNKYAILDLGLNGTSYGAMLPIYSNETFNNLSNATIYSVIGKDTYRYIMANGEAFILYNVTVSNSQELTDVFRKMAGRDYKVDVTVINLKKNHYRVDNHFWEDSDWKYLVHMNHGTLIINGGGSTLEDDYRYNFASLDPDTSIMVNNLEFRKFYRVFANNGEVYCENSTFTENDANKWATKAYGAVIHNKNKVTFKNCIFEKNDVGGAKDANRGGVLYADSNSLANFITCTFKTKKDVVRAAAKSMVIVYDNSLDAYNHIKFNGYFDTNSSLSIRKLSTLTDDFTKNLQVTLEELHNVTELIDGFNDWTGFNITLSKKTYVLTADALEKYRDSHEWRGSYITAGITSGVHDRSFIDINSKPVVINGNGATIKLTGNNARDDYHFAYIPKFGSLTLINLTLSGFNTAIYNYGTFTAINCTFTENRIHHIIKTDDFGGAIRNFGNVFCFNSTFKDNYANAGGAYYGLGMSSTAVFSNCLFTGNLIKSKLAWKNNEKNDLDIRDLAVVKLVNSTGYSPSSINTDNGGLYLVRDSINETRYNIVVDTLAAMMKAAKIVNGNTKYDIINITFVKGEYGAIPNSKSLFEADYGLILINGAGAKVFVQNPRDDDTTQFMTVASRGNVRINELTIEGFNIAIENSGKLTVTNSIFNKNKADYKFKADYGGAIVNKGTLSVFNSTFTNGYAKYAGAIYNTGKSVILLSKFSDNKGYHASKNVDIYNHEGCVDDIIVSGPDHSYMEHNRMASWKMDLIESSVLIATAIISGGAGYGLSAFAVPSASLVSMFVSMGIGGSLGTILGSVYTSEYQNPTLFWAGVLKGVSNGLKVAAFGGAAYNIVNDVATKALAAGFTHLVSKTMTKAVTLSQKVLNSYQKQSKLVYFV